MAFYTGNYGAPLARFDPRPMLQAAEAQAQMYKGLGEEFGGAISKYFEGQEEKKMAESMAENPIALEVVFGNQGTVPTDQKERVKAMRGVMRASGGYQNFVKRMENLELKKQNKVMQDQLVAVRGQQLEAGRVAALEGAEERKAAEAFRQFAFTPPPGQLTPRGEALKSRLGRFDPSVVRGTPEFEALDVSEPMGARPDIAASAFQARLAQERGPSRAPIQEPSSRFMQLATEAGLPPRAGMQAYGVTQQKATAEQAAATARLTRDLAIQGERRDIAKEVRDITKGEQETTGFQQEQKLKDFSGLQVGDEMIEGIVGDKPEAIRMKDKIAAFNQSLRLFEELQGFAKLREEASWYTGGMDAADKSKAQALAKQIQSSLRENVLGPGTATDAERKILENIVVDPTVYFSFTKGKTGADRLEDLKIQIQDRFKEELRNKNIRFTGKLAPRLQTGGGGSDSGPSLPRGITIEKIEEF